MAIYIGIDVVEKAENIWKYAFFTSNNTPYGTILVDTISGEIELLFAVDERARGFAFPRAKIAIQKHLESGELPDKLCYAA